MLPVVSSVGSCLESASSLSNNSSSSLCNHQPRPCAQRRGAAWGYNGSVTDSTKVARPLTSIASARDSDLHRGERDVYHPSAHDRQEPNHQSGVGDFSGTSHSRSRRPRYPWTIRTWVLTGLATSVFTFTAGLWFPKEPPPAEADDDSGLPVIPPQIYTLHRYHQRNECVGYQAWRCLARERVNVGLD